MICDLTNTSRKDVMIKWIAWTYAPLAMGLIFLTLGCNPSPSPEAEKAAVARIIDNNIGWFKDKNFELLFSTMTNGPDLFMVQLDTQSTIRGFEEFKKYSAGWRNPDVKYAGHKFVDLDIRLSQAGDTAWFSAMLEDCAQFKDRPARCFTTRYTGVLEKRAGHWLIVQQHFSLPAELVAEDWAVRTAHPPANNKSNK